MGVIRGQLEGSRGNKRGPHGPLYECMYEHCGGGDSCRTKGSQPSAALSFIIKSLIYSQEEGQQLHSTLNGNAMVMAGHI